MIPLPPLYPLAYFVAMGLIATTLVWVLSSRLVGRTRWSAPIRASVVSVFHGPVVVAIAAGLLAIVEADFYATSPTAYPFFLEPAAVAVLLELVILWSVLAVAARAVRRHVLVDQHPSGRYLILGIYTSGLLALVLVLLSSPEVPRLTGGIWAVFGFVAGLIATYIVVHVINLVLDRYLKGLADRRPQLQTIYTFLRRLVLAVVVLVGVAAATYANFPEAAGTVTSLVLAAGFLSIVIGLAAQSTLANIVAGAMVSLAQPFEIGDAVVFPYPNGDWCYVEDIRLTFTVLRTWDLRRLMVPNSMFQSGIVVNYTAVDPTMLVIVTLDITYESDADRAREIMAEEARQHPDFRPLGNLPVTHVMAFEDSGVQLRLLSAAKDQPTAFQMEKDLLASIRRRFQQSGIGLPYPTRRVILDTPFPLPADRARERRGSLGTAPGARRGRWSSESTSTSGRVRRGTDLPPEPPRSSQDTS